ncbi:MAG: malonyl-CoA decarboxylase [Polaromonas sp.]|uniref:malonyl-CoA decarboxylase n=1 Tax=Polaromonas sp. TaxID=1869339 RepID=UPI0027314621|nr:malonyl-CoA decarboxylase [Polaromonas sp.]MDP1740349.1 malonyl-CoA decarboxylase [Polaromonas sp.]MDP1955435.1 malonyl-CoA decarboxylase [Polaromonas sp.]MDP3355598.1 malonyl-CoA decarboxylase [Polaromonas sp.]MDP3753183.1 malonyl-CoA decarboxylase [Polaromonas sp.]
MNTSDWLARSVSRFSTGKKTEEKTAAAVTGSAQPAIKKIANGVLPDGVQPQRSTRERLKATLRQKEEALSPRVLRRTLEELKAIVDPQVSEVEGGRRASGVAGWYARASLHERRDMWLLMSEQFVADAQKVKLAQAQFAAAVGTPDEAVAEVRYRRATVSPRRRLLQRFSAFPEGFRFLVDLRADMLPHLKADKRLQALDVEMEYMFSTWFDVGFLDLRRISWDSPASLIEKLIRYEAVHDIKSWSDVKNRLDSDRRCYGFFHPRMPDEPLIFVEVALMDEMAAGITPLLDESAAPADLKKATTAIFYSISNTQSGLRGVSFGDSLIKRVVETLHAEFPRLKHFATLSPIPGFRQWLGKNAAAMLQQLGDKERSALGLALGFEPPTAQHLLTAADNLPLLDDRSPVRRMLLACAAHYLGRVLEDGKPLDPVARFHLGNGARVERLNWLGDPSPKGLKQSCGLMVNYLYDLKRLDKHRALLAQGKVPVSGDIEGLYI